MRSDTVMNVGFNRNESGGVTEPLLSVSDPHPEPASARFLPTGGAGTCFFLFFFY